MSAQQPLVGYGAALDWIQKEYGGLVSINSNFVSLATGNPPTLIVGNNADRMGLVIVNYSSIEIGIWPSGNPNSSFGIQLSPVYGSVSMNVRDDLTLPTFDWWGTPFNVAGGQLYFLEVIRTVRFGPGVSGA